MLAFTPEIELAFAWFHATHELTNADGRVWWRRTALPDAGGLGDQDCRVMAEQEFLESTMNRLIAEQLRPKPKAASAPAPMTTDG